MVLCLLFPLSTQNAQAPLSPDEYLLQLPAKDLVCIYPGQPLGQRLEDQGGKDGMRLRVQGTGNRAPRRCEQCVTAHFLGVHHI